MTDAIQVPADYSELGWLFLAVTLVTVVFPLVTILVIQHLPLSTQQ